MLYYLCVIFLFLNTSLCSYDFYGRHFIASYKKCDKKALCNINELIIAFEKAVQSSGATILKSDYERFPGGGMTAFIVLSESHASIHTYPEHNACFIDLFTCGSHCSYEPFDKILTDYLHPQDVSKELCIRK